MFFFIIILDCCCWPEVLDFQIDDADYARQLGLRDPPTLVHFSSGVPSIYYGDEKKDLILEWLIHLKEEAVIEVVTEEILSDLIEEEEYVMVLFRLDHYFTNFLSM